MAIKDLFTPKELEELKQEEAAKRRRRELNKRRQETISAVMSGIVIGAIVLGGWYGCTRLNDPARAPVTRDPATPAASRPWNDYDRSTFALAFAKLRVQENLYVPLSAKFITENVMLMDRENQEYRVWGAIEAQNRLGVPIRSVYDVWVRFNGADGGSPVGFQNWTVIRMSL